MEYVGCSVEFLKAYLERKFTEGMSWENYGRNGWHIDHIVPITSFDFSIEQQQFECWHFLNLQPLWEADNIRKSNTKMSSSELANITLKNIAIAEEIEEGILI